MTSLPDRFQIEVRLIHTTNTVEGYQRQVRKVLKNKGSLPTPEAVRKLLFLANRDITKKWGPEMLSYKSRANRDENLDSNQPLGVVWQLGMLPLVLGNGMLDLL